MSTVIPTVITDTFAVTTTITAASAVVTANAAMPTADTVPANCCYHTTVAILVMLLTITKQILPYVH